MVFVKLDGASCLFWRSKLTNLFYDFKGCYYIQNKAKQILQNAKLPIIEFKLMIKLAYYIYF